MEEDDFPSPELGPEDSDFASSPSLAVMSKEDDAHDEWVALRCCHVIVLLEFYLYYVTFVVRIRADQIVDCCDTIYCRRPAVALHAWLTSFLGSCAVPNQDVCL